MIIVCAIGQKANFPFVEFRAIDWFILAICSLFQVLSQKFSFMSNKHFTVSARETMKFNGFIFQIIIDVSLFHTEFSNL